MRVSIKWLKEFVEVPEYTADLAHALTMAGLEVEGIEKFKPSKKDLQLKGENPDLALLNDEVLEVNVTPNRPDALSHIGIAREVAAAFKGRLQVNPPSCPEFGPNLHDAVHVNVMARDAAVRYACRLIDNIQIGPSLPHLQARLLALGIRPVNNVVDVTNLVMLSRGQPLHAFDFEQIAMERGRAMLEVRYARQGEKLKTLDGVERTLEAQDLIIADHQKPLALAGVMGGALSEITQQTTKVLLECAYFKPTVVRKTARHHGLSTEASYRFERGVDPNALAQALDEAAGMLARLYGGRVCREMVDIYPEKVEPCEIAVRMSRIWQLSGLSPEAISEADVRNTFLALGMETAGKRGDALIVRAPTFRPDLTREVDLIEEVLRIFGYDKIPQRMLFSKRPLSPMEAHRRADLLHLMRRSLEAAGFYEAVNFSFGSERQAQLFSAFGAKKAIHVQNPLGEQLSVMRQSLLAGLVDNLLFNLCQGEKNVRLFEIGTLFMGQNSKALDAEHFAIEQVYLAGIACGQTGLRAADRADMPYDFYDMKGVLVELLEALDLKPVALRFEKPSAKTLPSSYHPGFSASVSYEGSFLGFCGRLHPDIEKEKDAKGPLYAFELSLESLLPLCPLVPTMQPIGKFPKTSRDLALLVDDDMPVQNIVDHLYAEKAFKGILQDLRVFDIYRGDKLPQGKKSVACSLSFASLDRTLTDAELNLAMDACLKGLQMKLKAQVR